MKAHKLLFLAGAAVITMSNFTLAQAQGDASPGQSLAREVCSECHAVEPSVLQSPNPDARAFQELANMPGMNAMTIKVWLQSPHRTMPLLVLDGAEIEGVTDYILSLERSSP